MVKSTRILALAVAVVLALTGCSAFVVNEERQNAQIVATVGTETLTYEDVAFYLEYLYSVNGIDPNSKQRDMVAGREELKAAFLESGVRARAEQLRAKELGVFDATDADREMLIKEATEIREAKLASLKESWSEKAKTDPSITDPDAMAQVDYEAWVRENMMTDELYVAYSLQSLWQEKLRDELTKDIAVADEELRAAYDKQLEEETARYADDLTQYSSDVSAGKNTILTPEGYRYVKHILIAISNAQTQDYLERRSKPLVGAPEELDKMEKERNEAIDAERAIELAKIEAQARTALSRLEDGEDFDSVMADIGQDPGMKAEPMKSQGYLLCDQTDFMPEFKVAALALENPGDITGLVATDGGYHIIQYVGDPVPGVRSFEEMKEIMRETMLSEKQTTAYEASIDEYVAQLESEGKIKRNFGVVKP